MNIITILLVTGFCVYVVIIAAIIHAIFDMLKYSIRRITKRIKNNIASKKKMKTKSITLCHCGECEFRKHKTGECYINGLIVDKSCFCCWGKKK